MAQLQRYCTPAGGGLHDGTSEANAWTLIEALANTTANKVVNCAGAFTHSVNSTAATANYTAWVSWTAGFGAIATDFSDCASVDFVGLASGVAIAYAPFSSWSGFHFLNAPDKVLSSSFSDWFTLAFNKFTDCVDVFKGDNGCIVACNKIEGSTAAGPITADLGFFTFGNELIGCTGTTAINHLQTYGVDILNYVGDGFANGIQASTGSGTNLRALNTVYSCSGIGISQLGAQQFVNLFNLLVNNTAAYGVTDDTTFMTIFYHENLYNNTSEYTGSPAGTAYVSGGQTTTDPGFTDIGNDVYTISEASLMNVAMGGTDQEVNIGAAQNSGGGGGGGGGYRPRIRKGA